MIFSINTVKTQVQVQQLFFILINVLIKWKSINENYVKPSIMFNGERMRTALLKPETRKKHYL